MINEKQNSVSTNKETLTEKFKKYEQTKNELKQKIFDLTNYNSRITEKISELNKSKENKVVQKIMYFLNKDNFTKTKLVLVAFASLAFAIVCEYTIFRRWYPQFISKNRIMLVSIIYMFIGIHFVFKLSKMYEFIHKNRYKIVPIF